MAIVNNISTEDGDVIRIQTDIPIIGIVALTSFIDSTGGETYSSYFNKYFRYSLNGGNTYTNWIELTTVNVSNIVVTKKDLFILDYKYEHVGSDPLTFGSLTLGGEFDDLSYPVYNRNIFSLFFDVNDVNVLGWALNVLEKIYDLGIIPTYVSRKWDEINPLVYDADYLVFWNTITHFFAIIVYYSRQFRDIADINILRLKFLKDLGVFLNKDITDTHLSYIMNNYVDEFKNRGTLNIVNRSNSTSVPDGELLRLIDYVYTDEFIFGLLEPYSTGWCLGKSSPMVNYTRHCKNIAKGYEVGEGVSDLTKYPISDSIHVVIANNIITLTASNTIGTKTGIYPSNTAAINKYKITIDDNLCYEVIIKIKRINVTSFDSLNFGILAYEENSTTSIPLQNVIDGTSSINFFFDDASYFSEDHIYTIKGIIFGKNFDYTNTKFIELNGGILDCGVGNHLKFYPTLNTKYIVPFLYLKGVGDSQKLNIYDLKVRPLNFNFTLGKFGLKNIVYLNYKNNSIYMKQDIYNKITQYLLPYNTVLIDNIID